jgi:hypothetical protein
VSFTVKVTTPLALEEPLAAETVELPAPCASVTVFPPIARLLASLSVTVIVEVVVPSAVTEGGLALTVDVPAFTGPTVKLTVAVWVTLILSLESLAV